MTNLFIAFSNNQIKNCAIVLKEVVNDYNVLVTSKTLEYSGSSFNEVIAVDGSFDNRSETLLQSLSNIIDKIKLSKEAISRLKKYSSVKDITLYFFYIEDILTNYLFFSFNPYLKGIVIEDGTLNYYQHTIKSVPRLKIISKWFLCRLFNVPFVTYKGHSSGIEYDHVLYQYVRAPFLSLYPEKSRELIYEKKSYSLSCSYLIVGQEPYINSYGRECYERVLKRICNLIKSSNNFFVNCPIYYKPHRHGARINKSLLSSQFPENEITILDASEPLESLYHEKLRSNFIYGFESSVFMNIYLETNLETRNKIQFTTLVLFNKQLKSIFERLNFRIVE